MNVKEYRYGNAIIRIYRPELSKNDQIKQERNVLIALEQFGKAMEENQNGNFNKSRSIKKKRVLDRQT